MMRLTRMMAAVAALGLLIGGGQITAASAAKKQPVVLETVPRSAVNTFFEVTSVFHPSMAQSIHVRKSQTWQSVTLSAIQMFRAKSKDVLAWILEERFDGEWFEDYRSDYATGASIVVEVWRYDGEGRVPEVFDLTDGFTRVHRSKVKRMIRVGKNMTLPFKRGVSVTPDDYVIVFGFRFEDPLMFNVRFHGQENGTNTMGGYDHDHPVDCEYTPSRDRNPGGQAYRPIPRNPIDLDNLARPFDTGYMAVDTKVQTSCNLLGVYDPNEQIWNPGDLRLVIRGRNR